MVIKEASVKYVRDNFAATLEELSDGKKVVAVTQYGKVKAYLVPKKYYESLSKDSQKTEEEKLKAFKAIQGMWHDRSETKDSVQYSRKVRKTLHERNYRYE